MWNTSRFDRSKMTTAVESWSSVRACACVSRAERIARKLYLRYVQRNSDRSSVGRRVDDVEDAALADDDRRRAAAPDRARRPRLRAPVARLTLQKLDAARDGVRRILRFDRARIGGVDPGEAPFPVANPGRIGNGVEHRPQRAQFGARSRLQLLQAGGLNALDADIADAQDGAAVDGTAFDVEMPALEARHRAAKGLPLGPQPADQVGELSRYVRRQPRVEGGRVGGRRQHA